MFLFDCFSFLVLYSSGTRIGKFPKSGTIIEASKLIDQAKELLTGESESKADIPVLGFYHPQEEYLTAGRIVVFGDSNCFDSANNEKGKLQTNSR